MSHSSSSLPNKRKYNPDSIDAIKYCEYCDEKLTINDFTKHQHNTSSRRFDCDRMKDCSYHCTGLGIKPELGQLSVFHANKISDHENNHCPSRRPSRHIIELQSTNKRLKKHIADLHEEVAYSRKVMESMVRLLISNDSIKKQLFDTLLFSLLSVGDKVDCLSDPSDSTSWHKATIKEISHIDKRLKVHYVDLNQTTNEWIPFQQGRLERLYTHTLPSLINIHEI